MGHLCAVLSILTNLISSHITSRYLDNKSIPPTPATTIPCYNIAAVISDVYRGFGQGRLSKDPRYVSQRMEAYLGENGLSCQIGSEVECFIFDDILFDNNNGRLGIHKKSDKNHSCELVLFASLKRLSLLSFSVHSLLSYFQLD